MSSSPEKKRSQPSSPPADWDQVSEQQLDEALSRASDLAGDLAREVVDSDVVTSGGAADTTAARSSQDPEAEIKHLDELLSQTKQQVGVSPEDHSTDAGVSNASTTSAPDNRQASSSAAVPDFMSEFMRPQETDSSPRTFDSAVDGPTEPNAANAMRDFSAVDDESTSVARAATDQASAMTTETVQPTSPKDNPAIRIAIQVLRAVSQRVSAPAAKVANVGVRAIEAIDRPLARVGPRLRSIVGWAAILFLASAVVVLLFARR